MNYFFLFCMCGLFVFAVTNEDDFRKWLAKQAERLQALWRKDPPKDKWGDDWRTNLLADGPEAAQRINSFLHGRCPHCGQTEFLGGPSGPGAQNFLCASCGSKFNNTVAGVDLIRDCTDPIPEIQEVDIGDGSHPSSSGLKLASHNREGLIIRPVACFACRIGAFHRTCPTSDDYSKTISDKWGFKDPHQAVHDPSLAADDSSVPPPGARRAAIEATKKKRAAEGRS